MRYKVIGKYLCCLLSCDPANNVTNAMRSEEGHNDMPEPYVILDARF